MRKMISMSVSLPVNIIADMKETCPNLSTSKALQEGFAVLKDVVSMTNECKPYLDPQAVNSVAVWNEAYFQVRDNIERRIRRDLTALGFKLEPFAGDE